MTLLDCPISSAYFIIVGIGLCTQFEFSAEEFDFTSKIYNTRLIWIVNDNPT
jgi:hypothetical protein